MTNEGGRWEWGSSLSEIKENLKDALSLKGIDPVPGPERRTVSGSGEIAHGHPVQSNGAAGVTQNQAPVNPETGATLHTVREDNELLVHPAGSTYDINPGGATVQYLRGAEIASAGGKLPGNPVSGPQASGQSAGTRDFHTVPTGTGSTTGTTPQQSSPRSFTSQAPGE